MTKDDIDRSIALGLDWSVQEFAAYMNASAWLGQAARGEVPSGNAYQPTGDASCPTSAPPVPGSTTDASLTDPPQSPIVGSTI